MAQDEGCLDDPVTVFRGHGRPEAVVVQSKLREAGIRSHLRYESLTNAYPFNIDGLGEMEVQVASSDAERARRVLEGTE